MTHTPHQLTEDFPNYINAIRDLKRTSPYFHKLAEEYQAVNQAIHRYETRIQAADDRPERGLRIQRMVLKDQIYAMLRTKPADPDG